MTETPRSLLANPFAWVVFIAILIRVTSIGDYPLADPTEARYSEMARIMVETDNWLTPQFDYDVPFWGKPPLSIWASAASFKLLGVNEFSARLPSILIGLLILYLVFYIARQQLGARAAWIALAFLSTDILFFILSGAVLMDPMMTLGITLSMVAFWQAMLQRGRHWGYLFFVGLSIGLMSKGPVAVVLTGVPIVPWLIFSGQWRYLWQRIPIFSGTVLMLLLSVPWYLLAEQATPGFLEYFFIGEHWKRFTVPGWSGDLYGTAHTSKPGAIWVNWLAVAFPMSLILIAALTGLLWRKKTAAVSVLGEQWNLYLILWMLTPMLFFTFSGNILATYVLPGMPAAALLVAGLCQGQTSGAPARWWQKAIAATAIASLLVPLIYLWMVYVYIPPLSDKYSEKKLIEKFHQLNPQRQARLLYYYERPYSARFYTAGQVTLVENEAQIREGLNTPQPVFLAVPDRGIVFSSELNSCMKRVQAFKRYTLYQLEKDRCGN